MSEAKNKTFIVTPALTESDQATIRNILVRRDPRATRIEISHASDQPNITVLPVEPRKDPAMAVEEAAVAGIKIIDETKKVGTIPSIVVIEETQPGAVEILRESLGDGYLIDENHGLIIASLG